MQIAEDTQVATVFSVSSVSFVSYVSSFFSVYSVSSVSSVSSFNWSRHATDINVESMHNDQNMKE